MRGNTQSRKGQKPKFPRPTPEQIQQAIDHELCLGESAILFKMPYLVLQKYLKRQGITLVHKAINVSIEARCEELMMMGYDYDTAFAMASIYGPKKGRPETLRRVKPCDLGKVIAHFHKHNPALVKAWDSNLFGAHI